VREIRPPLKAGQSQLWRLSRMCLPLLLWIDLKKPSSDCGIDSALSFAARVERCSGTSDIDAAIRKSSPDILCFEFDYPDAGDLGILQNVKHRYPSLPILMFTDESSTDLAIWALRTRVWDYFAKPFNMGDLCARVNLLSHIAERQRHRRTREVYMPEGHNSGLGAADTTTLQAALDYIAGHFQEKVSLKTVALLCRMGSFEFSRAFKREQGQTFRDFLIQFRVNQAAILLRNSRSSVLDIAYAVGFNDPSHFARMFRRYIGVTPSTYRNQKNLNPPAGLAATDAAAAAAPVSIHA